MIGEGQALLEELAHTEVCNNVVGAEAIDPFEHTIRQRSQAQSFTPQTVMAFLIPWPRSFAAADATKVSGFRLLQEQEMGARDDANT